MKALFEVIEQFVDITYTEKKHSLPCHISTLNGRVFTGGLIKINSSSSSQFVSSLLMISPFAKGSAVTIELNKEE